MRKRDSAKNTEHQRRWRERHVELHRQRVRERTVPIRARAHYLVHKALQKGDLVKGPCEVADDCYGGIVAHHDDYSEPLDVKWLCRRHHAKLHKK